MIIKIADKIIDYLGKCVCFLIGHVTDEDDYYWCILCNRNLD